MPSETVAQAKKRIRQQMLQTLRGMAPDDRDRQSASACRAVTAITKFRRAATVMLYLPLPTEVDPGWMAANAWECGKCVVVPTIDPDSNVIVPVRMTGPDHPLEAGAFGVPVPKDAERVTPERIDCVIVPGLAFDPSGRRLGRGGGFYDRFLQAATNATKIGLAFEEQIVQHVPTESFDQQLDMVVTDQNVWHAAK